MNMNEYESRFWKVLVKGDLADLPQFHKPGICDEVPLYTREDDVAFLAGDAATKDRILLTLSLKFLKVVIAYEEHDTPYFAAVTILDTDESPITPNLFVCNGDIESLYEKLDLTDVRSRFGRTIKKYLSRSSAFEPMEMLEDVVTTPETPRVFIGPKIRPYRGFVSLHSFHKPAASAKA